MIYSLLGQALPYKNYWWAGGGGLPRANSAFYSVKLYKTLKFGGIQKVDLSNKNELMQIFSCIMSLSSKKMTFHSKTPA